MSSLLGTSGSDHTRFKSQEQMILMKVQVVIVSFNH